MADTTINGIPIVSAARPSPRLRPLQAVHHFRRLVADKESTEHVFHIIGALDGGHFRKLTRAAMTTEEGRRAAEARLDLIPYLDDHDALARLPEGSLGQAYRSFMVREGLTARGLEAEERKFQPKTYDDILQWYSDRARDLHDLIHVLTGYTRGALGELSNLAWTYGMNRGGFGDLFIAFMGIVEMKSWVPKEPLFRVLREALRNGRAAGNLYTEDIEALFAMPLEDARAKLNIQPAPLYQDVSARLTAMSRDKDDGKNLPYAPVANG
ncbi:MAG: Coq4 family protein [Pseudomonadota bacterium]